MKQLVCDLGVQLRGHNLGHIQNIIKLLNERATIDNCTIVFLFNGVVKQQLHTVSIHHNITIEFITDDENRILEQCRTVGARRLAEFKLIKSYAFRYEIDEVLILELDQYQIAIGSKTTPFAISGIYFRPHYRIGSIGNGLLNKLKYFLWRQKKLWLEQYMCRNKNLHRIFIFNDQRTVENMNRILRPVFSYLPDPIYTYEPSPVSIRQQYAISDSRRIFLIFGAIDERKNIENLFAAFEKIDPELAAQATLLVIGAVKDVYKNQLTSLLFQLRQEQPSLQVIYHDQFISNSEMETLFNECDVPLLVYRDFFVSSGLLGQAAKYSKPVLVSKYGVMDELVGLYKLGYCVSPKDIHGIAKYYTDYIVGNLNVSSEGQSFYHDHTPEKFISTLFSLHNELTQIANQY